MISSSIRFLSLIYTVALLTWLSSCSSKKSGASEPDSLSTQADTTSFIDQRFYKIEAYLLADPGNSVDEEWVESDCALLISPTEDQITAMIKEYGEEDFVTIADDNAWYHSSASMLLDSIGVRVVTPSSRYVKLAGVSNTWHVDLRRPGSLPWNLILFSTKKGPQIFSTVDLSADQIREHFDLKPLPKYALEKFSKVSDVYSLGDGLSQQFLESDFSGDKKTDIAIWVERKDDEKKGVLFFFDGETDAIVVGAGKEFSHAGDDFKWAGVWEIIDANITAETTFSDNDEVEGSKQVTLERPAISIREVEGSGGLIYFNGKTFEWIHQGD